MIKRIALLIATGLLISATPPPHQAKCPTMPLPDAVRVQLTTSMGAITIELDAKHAPITSANFLCYVTQHRFDGITFYRAMRLAWGDQPNGLIQAGTRGDPARTLKPIAHEPTSQTGVLHKAGSVSMARFAPGTATGDFSILLSDMPGLDADPKAATPDAQAGYAAFGHVVEGMVVVRKIWDAPLSPTAGSGFLKGQMLAPPIKIISAKRVAMPAPSAAKQPPVIRARWRVIHSSWTRLSVSF